MSCSRGTGAGRWCTSTTRTRPRLPRQRRLLHPPDLAGERLEEGDHVGLVLVAQVERLDLLREPLVRPAALVVEGDDVDQGRVAPVVHVRRGLGDVPQSRRLEGAAVGLDL